MWREFAAAGPSGTVTLAPMSIVSSDRRHQGFDGALMKPHSNAGFTATKLEA